MCADDNIVSAHVHNKKDILILSKGPTQGSDDTTLIGEGEYFINFTETGKVLVKPALQWKQKFFVCKWIKNLPI